jgi:hypothetical protein
MAVPARGTVLVDRHFAIVPEWVIDAPISDTAFRLYSVLLRYGQSYGQRMPGRATLARRLHKKSVDTVDRALRELVDVGAVTIEHRHSGKQRLSNRYHLITDPPGNAVPVTRDRRPPTGVSATPVSADLPPVGGAIAAAERAGRTSAATATAATGARARGSWNDVAVTVRRGRTTAAGDGGTAAARGHRAGAAGMAAPLRHDPGVPTQIPPPPTSPGGAAPTAAGPAVAKRSRDRGLVLDPNTEQLLTVCGIPDLTALTAHCQQLRHAAGRPVTRWTARRLLDALRQAVMVDGHSPAAAVPALLAVAADPATTSPMRLAAPGPWWNLPHQPVVTLLTADEQAELDELTAQLDQLPDSGVGARHTARAQLTTEQQPLDRSRFGGRWFGCPAYRE